MGACKKQNKTKPTLHYSCVFFLYSHYYHTQNTPDIRCMGGGVPHTEQFSMTPAECPTTYNSDPVYLEKVSDPKGEELIPTRFFPPHFRCQSQVIHRQVILEVGLGIPMASSSLV